MKRALLHAGTIVSATVLAACGGGTTADGPAAADSDSDAAVAVIEDWSEALTAGDIEAAADLFAIPSVAENGPLIQIESPEDAALFNESLPCGAELEQTEVAGEFVTATFRLTTRPGVPACPGDGNTAQTTFVIKDGLIVEWRRVGIPGRERSDQAA